MKFLIQNVYIWIFSNCLYTIIWEQPNLTSSILIYPLLSMTRASFKLFRYSTPKNYKVMCDKY